MRPLDNPAARTKSCLAADLLGILAARPNMRTETKLLDPFPHFVIIVSLVQA
jgi:hypothetical protein